VSATELRATTSTFTATVEPLMTREIAGIGAIDAAIARERRPDYVVLFHGAKMSKQANVEQMATLVRMSGAIPDERAGWRTVAMKAQTIVAEHVSLTATLRAMRVAESDLVRRYTEAIEPASDELRRVLVKPLGRSLIRWHLLTAHLAKRTGDRQERDLLPAPLDDYFAGKDARACMRCHLDRPGGLRPLERHDPHPFTYVCAGCHVDVVGEFPPDLASQLDASAVHVREARIIQHALGRPSKLNAIGRVLHPLSGLVPQIPTSAAEHATIVPLLEPTPGPRVDERVSQRTVDPRTSAEAAYVRELFDFHSVRRHW
jgi:hypothetical protein